MILICNAMFHILIPFYFQIVLSVSMCLFFDIIVALTLKVEKEEERCILY